MSTAIEADRHAVIPTIGSTSLSQVVTSSPSPTVYVTIKKQLDMVLALLLLLVTLPLLLVGVILTKLTSRGPALYSQVRLGLNGRPFTLYKIRTMIHNCERYSGARWCIPGDPRITPVGKFLRKSKIDELPQLWNVLRGEMSLIGPRPERPELVPSLERELPRYRERLRVRPGVTGLAQVQLPADTNLESVRRKLACDLCYVRQVSLWLDLKIFAATGFYLLGIPFRVTRLLLDLPGTEVNEAAAAALETPLGPMPHIHMA